MPRYYTGTYISPKSSKPINYKSSWELVVAKWLDLQPSVVKYTYEPFTLPYVSNMGTGKIRQYYPDFLVEFLDGSWLVIEVKREDKRTNRIVQKKKVVAEQWCQNLQKQGKKAQYEIWTDAKIKVLRQEVGSLPLKKSSRKKKKTSQELKKTEKALREKLLPFSKKTVKTTK